jgi:hypothetical protein
MLEVYEALPILLPLAFIYYCIVDVFTPNPKRNTFYGWLYAEFLEHFVLPFVLLFVVIVFPPLFILSFNILVFYFYGFILGEIRKYRDIISVLVLVILFVVLAFYPDIILFVNASTGLGKIFITLTVIICGTLYFISRLKTRCGKQLLKGITLINFMHLTNALLWLCF